MRQLVLQLQAVRVEQEWTAEVTRLRVPSVPFRLATAAGEPRARAHPVSLTALDSTSQRAATATKSTMQGTTLAVHRLPTAWAPHWAAAADGTRKACWGHQGRLLLPALQPLQLLLLLRAVGAAAGTVLLLMAAMGQQCRAAASKQQQVEGRQVSSQVSSWSECFTPCGAT